MSETASVTALAVSENRPRKSGGCVGIFFQLFDWNKRFAKKRLFSKRLLPPPDRAKEASKKFGGDEKLPKLRLIADENSGGFPNKTKCGVSNNDDNSNVGKNNGVQTPSLVARLMGLDSLPSVQRCKLLKDSSGEFRGGRMDKVVGENDECDKEATRQETRPQKLQKTGMADRRNVSRFGAEALQLKNVLSRSRKHHHPKLASPVKSTSHHTRRNTSRLIGVATRILEPGGRNRSKYAITYPHSIRTPEPMKAENLDILSGHASCKNCGNLVDIVESTSKRDVHTTVFDSGNPFQVSPNGNSRLASSSFDQEEAYCFNESKQLSQPQSFASQSYYKDNNQRLVDIGVSSQAKLNSLPFNSDTRDFVALNKSLSGRMRSRLPVKVEDTKFDKRSQFDNGRDHGQKRQFSHIRKKGESSGVVCSSNNKARMVSSAASTGKQMESDPCSIDRIGDSGNKNFDGMGFRFKSPMKNRSEVPTKVERRRNQKASPCKISRRKNFTSNGNDELSLQKPFPLSGDSLGVIHEEKVHDLSRQLEYEPEINGTAQKRTPSHIFEELLCALNMERRPLPQKSHHPHHLSHKYDHNTKFYLQAKQEKAGAFNGRRNVDLLSPGSVLETSFSNDSFCSSSFEDSTVPTRNADSMSYSYDESQIQELETDPFYSDFVLSKENTQIELVTDLLTYISQVLCSIDLVDSRIKGNNLAHIKEVIFNTELVLASQIPHNPNAVNSFFVCDLLLGLDSIARVMWTSFGNFLGSENSNAGYQLKLFVFNALVGYLDSKYGQYAKCGFRAWMNLPPFMGPEILVHDVAEEVIRWMGFVGVTSDELVERDMSHSLGKWTDYEIEEYETGAKIEGDIFHLLIDEIVVDMLTDIAFFRL
uniref:uncharacterized protein LOC122609795 n=1 Tax=Erigeron canadensis TaxID=72917 RepID=UPI001CB8DF1E|nr:uncharacterized protein LOC122609795 [Erigeron canadensis]